jgi:hypothetical protein
MVVAKFNNWSMQRKQITRQRKVLEIVLTCIYLNENIRVKHS